VNSAAKALVLDAALINRRLARLISIHSRSIDGFQDAVPDLNMPAAMPALSF